MEKNQEGTDPLAYIRHTSRRYRHLGAFSLMLYASDGGVGPIFETIWNSRDGVTPFIVHGRTPHGEEVALQHTSLSRDTFARWHIPDVGSRIFVDMTRENHRARVVAHATLIWQKSRSSVDEFDTLEDFIEALERDIPWREDSPNLVEVDNKIRDEFIRLRIEQDENDRANFLARQTWIQRQKRHRKQG